MTEPLDSEVKRLRKLSPGDLADEAGGLKAQISDIEEKLAAYKDEAVRRDLHEVEGKLFRLVMSPPGTQIRLDREKLELAFGAGFVSVFSKQVAVAWQMRVHARKARHDRSAETYSETDCPA